MYIVRRATDGKHKFTVTLHDGRRVSFGAKSFSDYTKHKDPERMRRYLIRHQKREDWTRRGVTTPGFWARWVLWSSPTLQEGIRKAAAIIRRPVVLR